MAKRSVERNGLGKSVRYTEGLIEKLVGVFRLLRDERAIYEAWLQMVVSYSVSGVNSYDAYIAAAVFRRPGRRRSPDVERQLMYLFPHLCECGVQHPIGEIHPALPEVIKHRSSSRNDASPLGDQYKPKRATNWDSDCRGAAASGEVVDDRLCPRILKSVSENARLA